jgi:hypothetical protein
LVGYCCAKASLAGPAAIKAAASMKQVFVNRISPPEAMGSLQFTKY